MSTQETKPEPRRPKLRLPFDNRREDAGEWAFDHRAGLCVTLIAYLLLAIAFVGAKIVVGGRPAAQGFYIDLQNIAGSKLKQADVLMSTGVIKNPDAPIAGQRYVMKSVKQESGTLLPTLGITFEY